MRFAYCAAAQTAQRGTVGFRFENLMANFEFKFKFNGMRFAYCAAAQTAQRGTVGFRFENLMANFEFKFKFKCMRFAYCAAAQTAHGVFQGQHPLDPHAFFSKVAT